MAVTETSNEAQLIRAAVDERLMRAGIRDKTLVDDLDLSGVTVKDGKVHGDLAVLDHALEKHPAWFKPWDTLSEREFAAEREEMRERTRRRALSDNTPQVRLPAIKTHGLDDEEERALRNYVHGRASAYDLSLLEDVVKRQKAS